MGNNISDRKLAANRANAKKSTGPKTDEGKATSSQNARTHSLTALSLPLLQRDLRRFKQLQFEFRLHFQPVNAVEEDMVDRIIMARWHLSQAERLLQGFRDLAEAPDLPEPVRRDAVDYQKLLQQFREPVYETKPTPDRVEPLTNSAYRQDFYRQLQRQARKFPPASQDPSLPKNRPKNDAA